VLFVHQRVDPVEYWALSHEGKCRPAVALASARSPR
jgi:hypothetical protein